MTLFGDIIKAIPHAAHLQDKVRELEAEHAALETENAILKDDLRKAKAEIVKLKDAVERLTHKPDSLSEIETKILAMICENYNMGDPAALAFFLQWPEQRAEFYLRELTSKDYLSYRLDDYGGDHFDLTQQARRHLVEKGLL